MDNGKQFTDGGQLAGIPPRLNGEPFELYAMFLRFATMLPGHRRADLVAQQLGLSLDELTRIALEWRWVERVRQFDQQRLMELRIASQVQLQSAMESLLGAVEAVAQRVKESVVGMELSPTNVAALLEASASLAKAMSSLVPSQSDNAPVTLRDVLNVVVNVGAEAGSVVPSSVMAGELLDSGEALGILPARLGESDKLPASEDDNHRPVHQLDEDADGDEDE